MTTIFDLTQRARELYRDRRQGLLDQEHGTTWDRLTKSRLKDLPTHTRYIAEGLDSMPAMLDATFLTDDSRARVKSYLHDLGKGRDVVNNTLSAFDFLRDLAIEEGVSIFIKPKLERTKRNPLYEKRAIDGRYIPITRSAHISNNTPYGLRFRDWPEHLVREYQDQMVPYYTDELADRRNKEVLRASTMTMRLNRFERAFGIEVLRGVKQADLSFRQLATLAVMKEHRKFLFKRSNNKDTRTIEGYLQQFNALALNYFEDEASAREISKFISSITFKEVKDKQDLVERVHPDDLYRAFDSLVAEATHYEANCDRKYDRKFPKAQMAHHWMQAAVWGFTLSTFLRQENVARATAYNIYKKEDGSWHYRFGAHEMKGRRPKADEVIDLWRREAVQGLLTLVLDKAVQMRPHLIERFKSENPGLPDPQTFFLNMDGKPYTTSGMRNFFQAASEAYLGPEKRIGQHAIRTIVPSWLMVREGGEILHLLQNHLDHANLSTTEKHYIKTQKIFGARIGRLQMEERDKQKKALANLSKIPAQVAGLLQQHYDAMSAQIAELKGALNPTAMGQLQLALDKLAAVGKQPT